MDLVGIYLLQLVFVALQEALSAGGDCLLAGDACSADEACSPRLRTLRQCVAGDGSVKLGPGARSHCTNAVSALLSSPLRGCQCRRGMKKEKNCLSIYWSLYQSGMHGLSLVESYPYEAVQKGYDYVRLASIAADSDVDMMTVNRCLDAAKACNVDDLCQRLRTDYVSACIKPSSKSGLCNRAKCNKALRRFFDRVPPEFTHELLFCPCSDMACSERRRQTIVPSCSYEAGEKPGCLALTKTCRDDYVCRSRLRQFQYDCEADEGSASGCKQGSHAYCLLAYTGLIGSPVTPNYVDNSTSNVSPWCTCVTSGNQREQCLEFLEIFTNNICLKNALLAFGDGIEVTPSPGQPAPPSRSTETEDRRTASVLVSTGTEESVLIPRIPTQAMETNKLWSDSTRSSRTLANSGPPALSRPASPLVTGTLLLLLLRLDE